MINTYFFVSCMPEEKGELEVSKNHVKVKGRTAKIKHGIFYIAPVPYSCPKF